MVVSDLELEAKFKLAKSDANSPGPSPGHAIHYVRSFRLTVREVLSIMAEWESTGNPDLAFEECDYWKDTTEYLDLEERDQDSERQLERLLSILKRKKRIVVIAGAGISVSAGSTHPRSTLVAWCNY